MTRYSILAFAAGLVCSAAAAHAQTAAVETVQAVGVSSESIAAAGVQVRGLAEPVPGLRLGLETSWGDRSTTDESDAFGTAYPYGGRVDVIEAYAEWFRTGRGLRAVKAGRYRTPFGLAGASDHAYIGFLRPPLIRYGNYFALSTGYLEHGVDVLVGAPRLSAELSVGRPADVGEAIRRAGVNTVLRAEGSAGGLIVGASFIDTTPYLPSTFARGRARFSGVDARWMRDGVQLRGEWLDGQPFDGTSTVGGYLDAIVHTRSMGPVTALARIEKLDYDTLPQFVLFTHRYSAAMRMRVWQGLSVSLGVVHQGGQQTQRRPTAVDVGIAWALRKDLAYTP